ncbi:uncharacterized protein LOC134194109 isoform X2 [Corticium candelabrum]|uniref:uncharacterized protein LOC134194109 isoform X2 n=1 Tax=Corticium candelabrum TaxID=121492 RepID=UPI002E269A58|nr:uncharacterized protein LOC134194109 isoform X2 [Corticium candelabrum]
MTFPRTWTALLVLALKIQRGTATDNCSNTYAGNCYIFDFTEKGSTWDNGQIICNRFNYNLVSVSDSDENNYIQSLIRSHDNDFKNRTRETWIGLSKRPSDTTFTWSDKFPFVYNNWKNGYKPTMTTNSGCVYMDKNGYWAIANCRTEKSVVCKRAIKGSPLEFPANGNMTSNDSTMAIKCSRLEFPANGNMTSNDSTMAISTVVTFSCKHEFRLIGSTTRTCTSDGWTGERTICRKDNILSNEALPPTTLSHSLSHQTEPDNVSSQTNQTIVDGGNVIPVTQLIVLSTTTFIQTTTQSLTSTLPGNSHNNIILDEVAIIGGMFGCIICLLIIIIIIAINKSKKRRSTKPTQATSILEEGTPSESSGSTEQGDNTLISFREVNDSCYDRLASFSTSDANTLNNNQRETSSTAFGEGVSKSDNFTTDSAPNLQIQSEHTGDTYCQPGEIFKNTIPAFATSMQDHNQDESADRRLVGISRRDASTCDTVETESSSKVVQGRDRQHSAALVAIHAKDYMQPDTIIHKQKARNSAGSDGYHEAGVVFDRESHFTCEILMNNDNKSTYCETQPIVGKLEAATAWKSEVESVKKDDIVHKLHDGSETSTNSSHEICITALSDRNKGTKTQDEGYCEPAQLFQTESNSSGNETGDYDDKMSYRQPGKTAKELYVQLNGSKIRQIDCDCLTMCQVVGSGAFGKVTKAEWMIGGLKRMVAIKTLHTDSAENNVKFLREAAIMSQFHHRNVVTFYGLQTQRSPMFIAVEFMENGDLKDYLDKLKCINRSDTAFMLLRASQEISEGMMYLSAKSFVHRDLAARNVLVDGEFTMKIGDFGLTRDLIDETYYLIHGKLLPVRWTAVEALNYRKYSTASDVWSYGVLLYEIWSLGQHPFASAANNKEVVDMVTKGHRLPPPNGCPREVYELMIDCWHPDHHKRPTFIDIQERLHKRRKQTPNSHDRVYTSKPSEWPPVNYQDLEYRYLS